MLKHYSVSLALAIVVYGWNIQFESAHKQMGWRPPTRIRYLHRCRPRRTAASIPTSTTIITDNFQMAFDETRNLSDYPKGSFTFSIEPQKKRPLKKPRVRRGSRSTATTKDSQSVNGTDRVHYEHCVEIPSKRLSLPSSIVSSNLAVECQITRIRAMQSLRFAAISAIPAEMH